ncbi:SDR family NAD(P)-dependent oxidoreductase [Ilumatobacter sp.]|uniref:SDR family NAD(P)-dependent oxidoreductase n=1 Tax=Ilumatobacter sp. TaxID=1967498 RepID=UPI003B51EB69
MARWARALVTGASSGIGLELARALAADGTELVVVARDGGRLRELASSVDVACEVIVADLADPEGLRAVEDRLADRAIPIDLLVNDAGLGSSGPFHELDVGTESAIVDVNVVALHRLAHVAARAMTDEGHGGILNVSSMAGFLAAPGSATYGATKAFVTSFSESLHVELAPSGVHVTALCPGYTRTEFQERADYDASSIPSFAWQSASQVAAAGLDGIDRDRAVVVPGALNRVGAALIGALPRTVRRAVVAKLRP